MQIEPAARLWAETWTRAWPQRDFEAIASLYGNGAVYRSNPFRPHDSALGYLSRAIPTEENIECWFGEPIVAADRTAVQWWGSWTEDGTEFTCAGVTVLRFDDEGEVVDHRDYDHHVEQRVAPYDGW